MPMRMMVGVLMILATVSHAAEPDKKPPLVATCTRADALFKLGETATFRVTSIAGGEASYRLSEDGHRTIKEGKLTFERGQPGEVAGTLDKPGFLQLQVTFGKDSALAAAAFEPTKIQPSAPPPADFDTFWDAARQELAKVPMDAKLERSEKYSDARIDSYKITLANVDGRRVHGWISVPKGKGPFPAILTVPAAGVYGIEAETGPANLGALSIRVLIHDIPVDETPEFYRKQEEGALKDYRNIGMDDPKKNYFRQAILGCLRAADYVTSRPDYNGKDFAVQGGSQGGGLALIMAGLDPRVKCMSANIPALCDHNGILHDRISGWPQWLRRTKGEQRAAVMKTVGYFDAVNFARKFKGEALVGVGFIDTACAPTTAYAAFNVLAGPKTMIANPRMGHSVDPRFGPARAELWKKNLALKPPAEGK